MAVTDFENGKAKTVRLYPLNVGNTYDTARRGTPHLADPATAQRILTDLQRESAPFGTTIAIEGSVGIIRIPWRSARPTTRFPPCTARSGAAGSD